MTRIEYKLIDRSAIGCDPHPGQMVLIQWHCLLDMFTKDKQVLYTNYEIYSVFHVPVVKWRIKTLKPLYFINKAYCQRIDNMIWERHKFVYLNGSTLP